MADSAHLGVLASGVDSWNNWRSENPLIVGDLRFADLRGKDLHGANFRYCDLQEADLSETDLHEANFYYAYLRHSRLRGAILNGCNFMRAYLGVCDLTNASLLGADLSAANLNAANLTCCDLTGATLNRTNFNSANMTDTVVTRATVGWTVLADLDLSRVKGLDSVNPIAPCTVGLDTLLRSRGLIPETFLRGLGVSDRLLRLLPDIITEMKESDYYSCFISYSHKNEDFARHLYTRLRAEGIRVWFAPEGLKGGGKIYEQLEGVIAEHDKLLLILSRPSMTSSWVMTEIRRALASQYREGRKKLFPIRLVSMMALREWQCIDADTGRDLALEAREYYIPDFRGWKNSDKFNSAFGRLLNDLRAEVGEKEAVNEGI